MDRQPLGEPSPVRDPGPYASAQQALEQVNATTYGIPHADTLASGLVLREALLLGGVTLTEYETHALDTLADQLDPATAQVLAGWVTRARLAPQP